METMMILRDILLGAFGVLVLLALGVLIAGEVQFIKTGLVHQASHNRLLRNRKLAAFWADLLGAMVLTVPLVEYARVHLDSHHRPQVASIHDEDSDLVRELGFGPGQPVAAYWRRLRTILIDPRVHARLLIGRLRMNLTMGPMWRRAFVVIYWSLLIGVAGAQGWLIPLLIGYLLPITLYFQIAQILQALSEHRHWVNPGTENSPAWHARVSHTRFMGEAAPDASLCGLTWLSAWTRFWLRMIFIHLPLRIAVVTGENATHAAHHWAAAKADWTQAPYAYRDLKATVPADFIREFWGLRATLRAVFQGMSEAPPLK